MARHPAPLAPCILVGCWLASLSCTASAAAEFLRRGTALRAVSAGSQWRVAEDAFLGWLGKERGMPAGCNCQGQTTGTKCSQGQGMAGFAFPPGTTTMPAPAQPPIPPPPPPPPLPGPPPPLPLAPAKPLPGLPGLPGIGLNILPTLGPPPLFKMTPPPTLPPPVTTPPPPTTPGPTTPAWVETPFGLIAGTTPSPWAAFTTPSPWARLAPAPAPAPALPVQMVPIALLQDRGGSWNPLSFLHRTASRRAQRQANGQPCRCPCEDDMSSPGGVDRAFESVLIR